MKLHRKLISEAYSEAHLYASYYTTELFYHVELSFSCIYSCTFCAFIFHTSRLLQIKSYAYPGNLVMQKVILEHNSRVRVCGVIQIQRFNCGMLHVTSAIALLRIQLVSNFNHPELCTSLYCLRNVRRIDIWSPTAILSQFLGHAKLPAVASDLTSLRRDNSSFDSIERKKKRGCHLSLCVSIYCNSDVISFISVCTQKSSSYRTSFPEKSGKSSHISDLGSSRLGNSLRS